MDIGKLVINTPVMVLPMCQTAIKAQSERQESITRLVSLFPKHANDIYANIRNIEIKTYGIKGCITQALAGKTWPEIKELL